MLELKATQILPRCGNYYRAGAAGETTAKPKKKPASHKARRAGFTGREPAWSCESSESILDSAVHHGR
jgi:hypothetical protein